MYGGAIHFSAAAENYRSTVLNNFHHYWKKITVESKP